MEYGYLLSLALILLSTKIFGLVTKRVKLPQVVGALMAGLILGPACLGVLKETEFITQVSEIGVIVLMFCAGLETDIKELKKTGASSFIIALLGVIVPLLGGWGIASIFNKDSVDGLASPMLQNIFIGIILTATSVSITVETLKEMGRLLKILLFFIFAIVIAIAFNFAFNKWSGRSKKDLRRYVIIGFVFCLLMSFSAEHFFGVADITGAFVAGLALSNGPRATYLSNRFDTLSYMLLSPVFFASIGLKVVLPKMSASIILFAVILLIVAVITKVIGCGLGAKICKFSNKDSLRIGVGMVSRGEVALIVASKGAAVGLMNEKYFAPIVIMVVVTTIITPILLKFVYKSKKGDDNESKGELEVGKFTKSSALEEHEQNLINQKS